jgi:hypothetical protein
LGGADINALVQKMNRELKVLHRRAEAPVKPEQVRREVGVAGGRSNEEL